MTTSQLVPTNSYELSTLPAHKQDVIAKVYVAERDAYYYLAGSIEEITIDAFGRKAARVRFYAPIAKPVRLILWNNLYTEGAFVEIKFKGQMVAVTIEQIDSATMEVRDVYGETGWVTVASITQTMNHDGQLYGAFVMERMTNTVMEMELAS